MKTALRHGIAANRKLRSARAIAKTGEVAPVEGGVFATLDGERPSLATDSRGAIFAEYVILVALVTLLGALTTYGIGLPMLRMFRFTQLLLGLPVP